MTTLRLGTRRSKLAMTQSGHVADALRAEGHDVEIVEIVTEGDTSRASLASMGGHGVFASALREALLAGEIDIAVHSLKDLPTRPEPGLVVAAVPARVDPRDALCARDGTTASTSLQRPQFGLRRVDHGTSAEFTLSHGDMLRLLRSSGFTVDDLIEIQAPEPAHREYSEVSSSWARQWPSEEIWKARLTSAQVR